MASSDVEQLCIMLNLKMHFLLNDIGARVVRYILKHSMGTKAPSVSFMEYLENLPETSKATYKLMEVDQKQKFFTEEEREILKRETSYDRFDVPLLFKLMQMASEEGGDARRRAWLNNHGLESKIQYLIEDGKKMVFLLPMETRVEEDFEGQLKDSYKRRVKRETERLVNILDFAKERYNMSHDDLAAEKEGVVKDIEDIEGKNYEELMKLWKETKLPTFKKEILKNSRRHMQYLSCQPPLPFTGTILPHVEIEDVFSKMTMKEVGDGNGNGQSDILDATEVLKHVESHGQQTRPKLVMISGSNGSGKTAFLAFLASQWMKEESCRRMHGLEHYDVVLHLACKYEFSSSLSLHFQSSLNTMHNKYDFLLPTLARHCKVLILMDDVNMMHDNSAKLVNSILEESQDNPNITLICTTRPENIPAVFESEVSASYDTIRLKMMGIPAEERTQFVLKYYKWYNEKTVKDPTPVQKVMHDIGWRGNFQVPVNLVFLAKFFEDKPDSVTTTSQQSKIYQAFFDWQRMKLRFRMSALQVLCERRWTREDTIDRMLHKVNHAAMKALGEQRLYLTQEEVKELLDACRKEEVPGLEIIGAFFHYQQVSGSTSGKDGGRFSLLDKGLQEFHAAMYIAERFNFAIKQENIKNVMKSSLKGHKVCPATLKNVLWHLSAILTFKNRAGYGVQDEVVNMISQAGVSSANEWLALLEEADESQELVRCVSRHVKKLHDDQPLNVTDSTVQCATALLPLIPRRRLTITLSREPLSPRELMKAMADDMSPDLHRKHHFRHAFRAMRWEPMGHFDLLQALEGHTCTQLLLKHQFRHPSKATPSAHLLRHQCWSHLESFEGYLHDEGLAKLPQSLKNLSLVVAEDKQAQALLTSLASTCQSCPNLSSLVIHIPVKDVTPDVLVPLPTAPTLKLMLSGVDDAQLEATSKIAAILRPTESAYDEVVFPRSQVGADGWKRLMDQLAEAGVKVKTCITTVLESLTDEEGKMLDTYAVSTMGCNFTRIPEDKMW